MTNAAKQRMPRKTRGFTLIELMIVVAIIAVLATLAVVGFRKMINSSHTTEATHMVQAVRMAEESYRSEAGRYAPISTSLSTNLCPAANAPYQGGIKANWDPACSGGAGTWNSIPLHTDGPVMFGYAAVSGLAGDALPQPPAGMQDPPNMSGNVQTSWYVISARSDIDSNGTYCTVMGVSWTNQIHVDRETE